MHSHKHINWKVWIPLLTVLVTSFFGTVTTIAVTYINATKKAEAMNEVRREHYRRALKPNEKVGVKFLQQNKLWTVSTNHR